MSAPLDVLEALADELDQVNGLRTYSIPPGNVTPPAAICEIGSITAPAVLGGSADYTVRVLLLVQLGDVRSPQVRTLELIDPDGTTSTSAFAALLAYDPVGQVEFDGPGLVDFGGQQYAGGIFTVEVIG